MRGLSKAAALLSSTFAVAFVIPDPPLGALNVRPSDPIVEHIPAEAKLKFVINSVEPAWGYPLLTFEVGSSERACGESDLKLDGQQLKSRWTGYSGVGEGALEAFGGARVLWTIQCILSPALSDGIELLDKEGVQVLSLTVTDSKGRQTTPGFTISYRQLAAPILLHFEPRYVYVARDDLQWQTPSLSLAAIAIPETEKEEAPNVALQSLQDDSRSFLSNFKSKVQHFLGKLNVICQKNAAKYHSNIDGDKLMRNETRDWTDHKHGPSPYYDFPSVFVESDSPPPPTPVSQAKAAATRSIHPIPTSPDAFELPGHSGVPSAFVLKVSFLSLFLFAFITWIWLWHRDPRRRADRASRQEERRNKRLYRRAARIQKVKNFIWAVKVRYNLVYQKVLLWQEKGEEITSEEITEDIMKDDIRALRNAHRVVSSITGTASAAEEGHAGYEHHLRNSRSVSTLPGYESEGMGPPGYTSEFNSDSSVVSTSPRISLSSGGEYEEKVEHINLDEGRAGHLQS